MKALGVILLAVLSVTTCYAFGFGERGNRNIKTKEISISNYSVIEALGSADVYYEQKPNQKPYLRVEIDENLMQYVKVQVQNGILTLGTKPNTNMSPTRFRIYTNSTSLVKAGIKGSGDLYLQGKIQADKFEVYVKGSGDVSANNLNTKHLTTWIQGSGDITLKGQTDYLSATITGSGDLNTISLSSKNADCLIKGSGDLSVNASGQLNTEVRGSGDITYAGSPRQLNKSVRGSGSISKK